MRSTGYWYIGFVLLFIILFVIVKSLVADPDPELQNLFHTSET